MSIQNRVLRPRWNARCRELIFRSVRAKVFRKYAPNQELVLQAFEESDWSTDVDDPLPVTPGIIPAERLREAVKRLNRSIAPGTIRFGVCGNGRRVYWRAMEP